MTDLSKLLEKASEADRTELEILQAAEMQTRTAYQGDYSAAKKKDWDAAREGLADAVARMEARYFHKAPAFDSLAKVHKHLEDDGYKIGKSKLYKDAAAGLIRVESDKTVLESEVRAYAATLRRVSDSGGDIDETNVDKAKKELEKLDIDIEQRRFNLEKDRKLYLLKADVHTEVAVKIGVMESGVKHLVMMKAADWIHAVGGDAKKKQVMIDLFMADFDALLDELGQLDEIDVVIERRDVL